MLFLMRTTKAAVCLQTKSIVHHFYGKVWKIPYRGIILISTLRERIMPMKPVYIHICIKIGRVQYSVYLLIHMAILDKGR